MSTRSKTNKIYFVIVERLLMTSQKGLNNFLTAYYYKVWGDKRWVRQYQNISVTWFVDDPWLRRLERRLPLSKWLYKKYVECESENTSRISIACSVRHGILSIMTSFWTALTRFPFGDRKVSPWQQKKWEHYKSLMNIFNQLHQELIVAFRLFF